MADQRIVVVLPTYNEVGAVGETIDALLASPLGLEVLVVDDNSPDGTADVVAALADQSRDRVRLLRRDGKHGLGRAYAAGFGTALADPDVDAVVQMDADGSHTPADVDRLVAALARHDLAIGSRYCPGGDAGGLTTSREWLSRGGNGYARLVLGTGVRDLTGGFKAWRASLLRRVDAISSACDGYAFQIEMTLRAARSGADIVELPIAFRERRAGVSKMTMRIAAEAVFQVPWMALHYASHRYGR